MMKQKRYIKKLREYSKQQDEKKKASERRMKRKTIFLYLDMQSRNNCGKYVYKWKKYAQNEIEKKNKIYFFTNKIEQSILKQFVKRWRDNCDKLESNAMISEIRKTLSMHTTSNVVKQALMKSIFAWKRYTVNNLLMKDSLSRSLQIYTKQSQRSVLKQWQKWLKLMDMNEQLEYQRRQTQKFESEINELRVSVVGLQEENKTIKLQQQYAQRWKLKMLHIKDQRVWLQNVLILN